MKHQELFQIALSEIEELHNEFIIKPLYEDAYEEFMRDASENGIVGMENLPFYGDDDNEEAYSEAYLAEEERQAHEYVKEETRFIKIENWADFDRLNRPYIVYRAALAIVQFLNKAHIENDSFSSSSYLTLCDEKNDKTMKIRFSNHEMVYLADIQWLVDGVEDCENPPLKFEEIVDVIVNF